MKELTQQDIDAIVKRAKELGAGDGLTHKMGQFDLRVYKSDNPMHSLSSLIVNAWDGKYDLIYAFQAAFEYLDEQG